MKLVRKDLLQRLMCVESGLSKREAMVQSSCVVIQAGRFYTLSMEVACSIVSELPPEWEGAVVAEKLIKLLKELPDDEIEFDVQDKILIVKGKSRRMVKIAMEEEVLLAIADVELPKKGDWVALDESFSEAIGLVSDCTIRKEEFIKECIHIAPEWLEASDDSRLIRYRVPTFVKESVLVRGESIKSIAQLGMTRAAVTENWLHFRNPMGLRMSVKKFAIDSYPNMSEFLDQRGRRIKFSKSLGRAVEMAGIFANDMVDITVNQDGMTVNGKSAGAESTEECKVLYTGKEFKFSIPPNIMVELTKQSGKCEITENFLRLDGGKFVLVTALHLGESNEESKADSGS